MPCFSMDELSDFMLELLISERVRLTDVKGGVLWKIVAFIDGQNNGFHEVIEVNERIAVEQVAGIKITRELLFVNALNLVRDWYGMAFVVVCAGETEDGDRNMSTHGVKEFFCFYFRLGVVPGWIERPLFVDLLAGFG